MSEDELSLEQIREIAKSIEDITDIYQLDYPMYTRQLIQFEWKSKLLDRIICGSENEVLCPSCWHFLSFRQFICINNTYDDRDYYCFQNKCVQYRRMTYRRMRGILCTPTLYESEQVFTGRRLRHQGWWWPIKKPAWYIYFRRQLRAFSRTSSSSTNPDSSTVNLMANLANLEAIANAVTAQAQADAAQTVPLRRSQRKRRPRQRR